VTSTALAEICPLSPSALARRLERCQSTTLVPHGQFDTWAEPARRLGPPPTSRPAADANVTAPALFRESAGVGRVRDPRPPARPRKPPPGAMQKRSIFLSASLVVLSTTIFGVPFSSFSIFCFFV